MRLITALGRAYLLAVGLAAGECIYAFHTSRITEHEVKVH